MMAAPTAPRWRPILPDRPTWIRKSERAWLRLVLTDGGEEALRLTARTVVLRRVSGRASCPADVAALRAWLDLETEHVVREMLEPR